MQNDLGSAFGFAFGLILLVVACVILGITIRFCIDDANRRGKSPALVRLAVIQFFPWGSIAWLLSRPGPVDRGGGDPGFRLDRHRLR